MSELLKQLARLPKYKRDEIQRLLDSYSPDPVLSNDGAERNWSHLNCPMCGGSGHIDDVAPKPEER